MDTGYEDKIYRQIEKSLADNLNEKLYVPIEMIDKSTYTERKNKHEKDLSSYKKDNIQEDPILNSNRKEYEDKSKNNYNYDKYYDEYNEDVPTMSRAEYIRRAREACLRQMNTIDNYGRIIDNYINEEEPYNPLFGKKKKDKVTKLFQEGREEEDMPDEIASYKSLIIRTVCAVVIFISIFIIDKVKVDWGNFSYETIKHYVTGNNQLKTFEEIIVSWLK